MDLSFDLKNSMGDHLKVALSNYDKQNIEMFSKDPSILNIDFYNVSLERKARNSKFLSPHLLIEVCKTLFTFMKENPNSVLTYICDPESEVERHHKNLSPQEYRSKLFSKLFDYFTFSNRIEDFIEDIIHIKDNSKGTDDIFAHFIYPIRLKTQIETVSNIILSDK